MAKVMTYATAIDNAIAGNLTEETVERLNALKVQLAKRNSGSGERKPTKTQRENEEFKGKIVALLTEEVDGMTATEIGNALAISCQRVSPILKKMVEAETLAKVKEGKVMRFVLA